MFELKLSMKKIYSIALAGISLLLFIFSFIQQYKVSSYYGSSTVNLWDGVFSLSGNSKAVPVIMLFSYIGIITVYLLNLFGVLKEKWVSYANYATGYIFLAYLTMFFLGLDYLYVGMWFGLIFSAGLVAVSVLWNFASDEPLQGNNAPITGYDPATGKPIYAKPTGFDPVTGKPIYK